MDKKKPLVPPFFLKIQMDHSVTLGKLLHISNGPILSGLQPKLTGKAAFIFSNLDCLDDYETVKQSILDV